MRHSIRAHALFYTLNFNNEDFVMQVQDSEASFVDLGFDFEFNWWPYKTALKKTKYTPYISAGVGYCVNYDARSVSHLYLPFGGGLKANLGKRLSGGVELSARKMFNDKLDGMENWGGAEVQTPLANNDWYMHTGIFVTYKIFDFREACPTYD